MNQIHPVFPPSGELRSLKTVPYNFFKLASQVRIQNYVRKFEYGEVLEIGEKVVGDARFELATPWTQTKCATKLR